MRTKRTKRELELFIFGPGPGKTVYRSDGVQIAKFLGVELAPEKPEWDQHALLYDEGGLIYWQGVTRREVNLGNDVERYGLVRSHNRRLHLEFQLGRVEAALADARIQDGGFDIEKVEGVQRIVVGALDATS